MLAYCFFHAQNPTLAQLHNNTFTLVLMLIQIAGVPREYPDPDTITLLNNPEFSPIGKYYMTPMLLQLTKMISESGMVDSRIFYLEY